jgi:glycosyltransferase involved in cell wall biosynthesis
MITYSHEKFIREAIEGVLLQKINFDIELVIVDDNSPDNTESVVKSFSNHPNYHWIKYTKHKENKGMMPNFIWAMEQAKGKYIALCEGDDYWSDHYKLKKQVDFLEANQEYSLVYHPCMELKDGELYKEKLNSSQIDKDLDIEDLLLANKIHTPSVLFRSLILPLPLWFKDCPVGDYPLWVQLGLNGKIRCIADYMAVYRIHITSSWSSQNIQYTGTKWLKVLDLISTELNDMQMKILFKQYKTLYNRIILEYKCDFNAILDLNSSLNNQSKLMKFNCKNNLDVILRWPVSFWELFLRKLKKYLTN